MGITTLHISPPNSIPPCSLKSILNVAVKIAVRKNLVAMEGLLLALVCSGDGSGGLTGPGTQELHQVEDAPRGGEG